MQKTIVFLGGQVRQRIRSYVLNLPTYSKYHVNIWAPDVPSTQAGTLRVVIVSSVSRKK